MYAKTNAELPSKPRGLAQRLMVCVHMLSKCQMLSGTTLPYMRRQINMTYFLKLITANLTARILSEGYGAKEVSSLMTGQSI